MKTGCVGFELEKTVQSNRHSTDRNKNVRTSEGLYVKLEDLDVVKLDLEIWQNNKVWRFLQFLRFLEDLDNYFDKPGFLK